MITINYTKPFTNNIEIDVKDVRDSYMRDLQRLRSYYAKLFVKATPDRESKLRRAI